MSTWSITRPIVRHASPHPGDPGSPARARRSRAMHTDIPTRSTVERLLSARDDFSVSIYVPTSPLTQEARASRIELKNLSSAALRQLEEAGADRRGIEAIREELDELVDDEEFWEEQARSLA